MWGDHTCEYVTAQHAQRLPHTLLNQRLTARHEVAIDDSNGRIVGYARWRFPEDSKYHDAWPEAMIPSVSPEEFAQAKQSYDEAWWEPDQILDHLDRPAEEMKMKLMRKKEYLLLDLVVVHPEYRRQGIVFMLVESGIRAAEKIGIDCFVQALREGRSLYERAGFVEVGKCVHDGDCEGQETTHDLWFWEYTCKRNGLLP